MAAKLISLCDYRKKKSDERRSKSVKGRGFPDTYELFRGFDDAPENFGGIDGLLTGLSSFGQQGPITESTNEDSDDS